MTAGLAANIFAAAQEPDSALRREASSLAAGLALRD
jgi:hypothetical protein